MCRDSPGTCCLPSKQWSNRNEAILGFPGEESLVFKFCPRKGLFSATGAGRIPRQEVALGENLTENGLVWVTSGTALAMRAGVSRDVMEVHRMRAHPSEDITRKTAEMMGIKTTGQWRACETCFQVKTKRHAVPKKTDQRASVKEQSVKRDCPATRRFERLAGRADRACIGRTHTKQCVRRREVASCRQMATLHASGIQGSSTGGYVCADASIAIIRKT